MKNIVFDLGRVLIKWDPDVVYKEYFTNDLVKLASFYKETSILEANTEMDRGRSFQEVLAELANKFPHYSEPIYLWKTKWLSMIGGPIEDSVKILKSLHARNYPLYALTNFATETFFPYIRYNSMYGFLDLFKDIVVSGVERIIKPDPKIYELLLYRNKLDPKNCIYIDDSPNNLVPAQNLGMSTIEFISPEQLARELQRYLFV